MLNFFKRESADRKAMRKEFEEHTKALRNADDLTQIAVGHAINIAHSMFIKRFGSAKEFGQQPINEKIKYIQSLSNFEEKIGVQDPLTALGSSLFKKWLAALAEADKELMSQFRKELDYFSRKGDIGV